MPTRIGPRRHRDLVGEIELSDVDASWQVGLVVGVELREGGLVDLAVERVLGAFCPIVGVQVIERVHAK
jgi:hypothetical protein